MSTEPWELHYTDEQILAILKEAETAPTGLEVLRRHGVTARTYCRWEAKYAGMDVNEATRLRALEGENRRLKRLAAEQALDNQILREALGKD